MTASPGGLEPHRAVQVIIRRGPKGAWFGSGYQMTADLVLTAAHVVHDAVGAAVRFVVGPQQVRDVDARIEFSDAATDIALLRIEQGPGVGSFAGDEVSPVQFGKLAAQVDCEALGLPRFKLHDDTAQSADNAALAPARYRDFHHAYGKADPWSNVREGTLEIAVAPPEDDADPHHSPWEGMSGAAVWAEDLLIGVISKHHPGDGLGTLAASRVDHWHLHLSAGQAAALTALIGLPAGPDGLVEITAPKRPAAGPRQLPVASSAFTGRGHELAELFEVARRAQAGDVPGSVVISAIDGMAGIGKTALAVHAGHHLTEQFPDGQLFVDLHGYTQDLLPREPADVLASILQAYGVPPEQLPADLDARAALYRDRLSGTRTLIVLDNAATETQLRPLLPGGTGCLVLITSRKRLKALDEAYSLSLDVLSTSDAVALFCEVARRELVPTDDSVLEEVARLCGCLPLALRIAAALIRNRPAWTAQYLASRLGESRPSLEGFSDGDRSLTAVFDLSYRTLADDQRLLVRRLGLVPGPETDAYAAAALLDVPVVKTDGLLQDLVDHNLLAEPRAGRYQMHDLVRAYARSRAYQDDTAAIRDSAAERLLDFYQHVAQQANRHLSSRIPAYAPAVVHLPREIPALESREQADAWIGAELANLAAAADHAATRARPAHVVALAAALHEYLRARGPWARALSLHATAADVAGTLSDRRGQATALNNLSTMRRAIGDYSGAVQAARQALDLFDALGDYQGQAAALGNLGLVAWAGGDYPEAAKAHRKALDLYRVLDDRQGQALALGNLGLVSWSSGDFPEAAEAHQKALELFDAVGDRRGQASALTNLGIVRDLTGDYPGAIQAHQKALDLCRALGDVQGQASALTNLGIVRDLTGDYPGAVHATQEALELYRALGDRQGQASALDNLGVVRRSTGDCPGALDYLREAVELFREVGDRGGEVEALNHYAQVYFSIGDLAQAHAHHDEALRIAREITSSVNEAEALEGLGEVCLLEGRPDVGVDHLRRALEIYRRLGVPGAQRIETRMAELE